MIPALIAVGLLASAPFVAAASYTAAPQAQVSGNLLGGSLIEALIAIKKPELGGVFTYVGDVNAPRAFADLIARDPKAMKLYTKKLAADRKVAGGLTAWDHEVCATLVTYYAGPPISGLKVPDGKILKALNEGVLAPVLELQEIVSRRGK